LEVVDARDDFEDAVFDRFVAIDDAVGVILDGSSHLYEFLEWVDERVH